MLHTMDRPFDRRLGLGLALLAALVMVNAGLGLRNVRQLHNHARLVVHTHEVLSAFDDILSTTRDAETAQRGFLITGDSGYLKSYHDASAAVDRQIADGERLTSDNARQQARFRRLRPLIQARLDRLGANIALRTDSGFAAARAQVLTGDGTRRMDEIRGLLTEMRADEDTLLQARQLVNEGAYRSSVRNTVASTVIALMALLGFVFLLERHLRERQAAATLLYGQRESLRMTLASIGDAVIVTDSESRVSFLNHVAQTLTGWSEDECRGLPVDQVFRIVNEDTRTTVENPGRRAMKEGTVTGLANHTILIAKSGAETPIDDSAAPIYDEQGRVTGVVLVFRDITARRHAEAERRAQFERIVSAEQRIRSVVENAVDGIVMIDEQGTVQAFNSAAERIFGYSTDEVAGQNVKMLMPEPYLSEHDGYVANYLRTGEAKIIGKGREVRGRRKDGSTFPMDLAVSEFHLGDRRYFTGIVRDITQRKADEVALREQAELLDLAHDAILVRSHDGTITYWSRGAESMYGWPREQALGNASHSLLQTAFPKALASIEADLAQHGWWEGTLTHSRQDGTRIVVASRWSVRHDGTGTKDILEINSDISRQIRAEDELRQADRRKNQFLAVLSHELRNPLSAIRNALEILKIKGSSDPVAARNRDIIERQIRQMGILVEDLLDVSRISRGALVLHKEPVNLEAVIQTALEASRPLIEASRHELTVALPSKPVRLIADPVRLSQVFSNLLNNAAKYTDAGGCIRVTARTDDNDLVISVQDNGIGISPEYMPHLFEIFSQATESVQRAEGGIGIGLSLVKGLVELHGGCISVQSDGVGRGSEFIVRMPLVDGTGPSDPPG
jgi:PAS domain S-box-containing protein